MIAAMEKRILMVDTIAVFESKSCDWALVYGLRSLVMLACWKYLDRQ